MKPTLGYLGLLSLVLSTSLGFSQEAPSGNSAPQPYLCIGYNPGRQDWNPIGPMPLLESEVSCDPGYAFFSVDFPGGTPRPGNKIPVRGRCCRLPDGVLRDDHVFSESECPEGRIATGAKSERKVQECPEDWKYCIQEWESLTQYLRCSKINEERFQLGPKTQGYTLGFNEGFDAESISGDLFTTKSRIPLGLRHGVSRKGKFGFDGGGYIGYPWGSVLTAKESKSRFYFRQIQFLGIPGDPVRGTPLRVYPDCDSIDDSLDPNAVCMTTLPDMKHRELFPLRAEQAVAPPPFPAVLIRHEARILQLAWAVGEALRLSLISPEEIVPPDVVVNPLRWSVESGERAKDSVFANILSLLEEQEFFMRTLRDRALPSRISPEASTRSFAEAGRKVLAILSTLQNSASKSQIEVALSQVTESLRMSLEALLQEGNLEDLSPDAPIPITTDEMSQLRAYGILGPETTVEMIEERSKRILSVFKIPAQ